jgi:hypothetical protein
MSYGILSQLNVKTLRQAVERVRALAGSMRVDHPITIVSPKGKVWRIPSNTDIEVSNVVVVILGAEGLDAEWLDEGFEDNNE